MIYTLLISLMLVSPPLPVPQLKKCANACGWDDDVYVCGYWEKAKCGRQEIECIDGPKMVCEPNEVRLGTWRPVLLNYKPWKSE
jgi:hypothetical protein